MVCGTILLRTHLMPQPSHISRQETKLAEAALGTLPPPDEIFVSRTARQSDKIQFNLYTAHRLPLPVCFGTYYSCSATTNHTRTATVSVHLAAGDE